MKNLITGGAGFIGSHLAEYLLEQGEEVIVLDDLSTGNFNNIRNLVGRQRFAHLIGEVENEELLYGTIESVDNIYHLAAAVGVQMIVDDPVRTIETNINASQAVLKFAVTFGKRVLITSTSEVYGKGTKIPFCEEDDVVYGSTMKARWSYAISKAVDEFLLLSYHKQKGLPGVIVRLFNTVGPRQTGKYGMVLPRFVRQAMSGGPIGVFGTGNQKRCFAHVKDVVPALHAIMNCQKAMGKVINLGNDVEVSILELAEKVKNIVNKNVEIIKIPYEEAYGPGFEDMEARKPDLKIVKKLIGYNPRISLDEIILDVLAYEKGVEI